MSIVRQLTKTSGKSPVLCPADFGPGDDDDDDDDDDDGDDDGGDEGGSGDNDVKIRQTDRQTYRIKKCYPISLSYMMMMMMMRMVVVAMMIKLVRQTDVQNEKNVT